MGVIDTKRGCLPRSGLPSGDVDVDDVSSAAATISPPRARSLSVSLATLPEPRRHVGEILDAPGRNGDKGPVLANELATAPRLWRVPSSRLLFSGRSLALVVFEPPLHELVEFLHLFVGVGFWRAVFQPTEHVSFD